MAAAFASRQAAVYTGDTEGPRFVLPVVSTCLHSRGNSEDIHSLILTPLVLMHFRTAGGALICWHIKQMLDNDGETARP